MNKPESADDTRTQKRQQIIKWTVYALLIVNFLFYIAEDWGRAVHTINAGSAFLDWTSEFATSIDELAWFLLLAMFELETYVLSDQVLNGWVSRALHGIRLFCYVMIAHTIYAFSVTVIDLQPTIPVEGISDLCMMTDSDVSYVYNLEYTSVDEANCAGLSDESRYFWLTQDEIVSDARGLELERDLAWADLIEVVVWLLILLAIELNVQMQNRGVIGGPLITIGNTVKLLLYAILIVEGIYWATLSHWLYLWDELLWIGGFAAIEWNVSNWRDELKAKTQFIGDGSINPLENTT